MGRTRIRRIVSFVDSGGGPLEHGQLGEAEPTVPLDGLRLRIDGQADATEGLRMRQGDLERREQEGVTEATPLRSRRHCKAGRYPDMPSCIDRKTCRARPKREGAEYPAHG